MKYLVRSILTATFLFMATASFAASLTTPASVPQPRPYKVIKLTAPQIATAAVSASRPYTTYAVYDQLLKRPIAAFPTEAKAKGLCRLSDRHEGLRDSKE